MNVFAVFVQIEAPNRFLLNANFTLPLFFLRRLFMREETLRQVTHFVKETLAGLRINIKT